MVVHLNVESYERFPSSVLMFPKVEVNLIIGSYEKFPACELMLTKVVGNLNILFVRWYI